jgi:hypothetical protein
MAVPLAAEDVSATLVVKNEVNRSYKVTMTPAVGDPQKVTLAQGERHSYVFPPGEACEDQSIELEMRFVSSPVNRVDGRATFLLVAVDGEAGCALEVRKPTEIYEREYDNYFQWTKIDASKGRMIFKIRYGV